MRVSLQGFIRMVPSVCLIQGVCVCVCESVHMSSACVWAGIKRGFRDTSNECVASVSDSADKISETEIFF